MGKYVLVYTGGRMAESDEERQQVMAAWGAWFQDLGDSVLDPGNPFAGSASVSAAGADGAARSGLSGYSILSAASLEQAVERAQGCPVLGAGGGVEVYETHEVM